MKNYFKGVSGRHIKDTLIITLRNTGSRPWGRLKGYFKYVPEQSNYFFEDTQIPQDVYKYESLELALNFPRIEKNSNKDVNSQLKQDNNFVNNNINQTLEKYRKEIIGDTKEEPIVPTTAKLNSQKKENPNYQDNSIILKQAYNEKLKKNTNETKDLLTNKNNNQ